jgi:hypothetical protein
VRMPFTVESLAARTNIATGIMDALNNSANTSQLSSDKIASVPSSLVTWSHAALSADSDATNFVANLTAAPYQTITAADDVFFLQSTNRAAVRNTVLRIVAGASDRELGFNEDWIFIGTKPTNVLANTVGILSLTSFGTAETDIVAAYASGE